MREVKGFRSADEVDYNEVLISDSAVALNTGKDKEVYCFTSQQAEAIVKKCNFKCSVTTCENVFVVRRIEAHRLGKGRQKRKRGAA